MKKLSLTLAALALVLGMSQCKKQEEPVQNGEKQHIVLNASFAESNSKIAEDGFGGLKWSDEDGNEDHIIVKNSSQEKIGELECTYAENGIFEGDITSTTGNITFTFGEEKYMEQTGELNAAMHLTSPEVEYKADGNYGSVLMSISNAVLKLDVSALGTTGAMTIAANGATVASVTDVASSEGKAVFVAVPANETSTEYTITCGGKTATKTWTLEKNVFYTKAGAEGAGTGDAIVIATPKFSVSSTTKVEFAPGNLYWDGSSWQFEANQWDFRTYASKISCIGGSVTTDGTPAGHWGLFGWSTSATIYGMSTSIDNSDYSGDFVDWGGLAIGDYEADTWRTLSKAEWDYLLNTRTHASDLCAWKDLGRHKGLVILPDGTENPSEVLGSITSVSDLATHGAVFLPAAGRRYGTDVDYFGSYGVYMSSTPYEGSEGSEGSAYSILFGWKNMVLVSSGGRSYGYAVRLVR